LPLPAWEWTEEVVVEASGFSATICDLLLRALRCSGSAAKARPVRVIAATTPKARKAGLARVDDFFVVFPVGRELFFILSEERDQ
jgi:hypothetical protein